MSGRRVLALYGALLLGFAAVVCRLYWLCSNTGYAARASAQSEAVLRLPAARGNFYDCDGLPLTGLSEQWLALCFPGEGSYARLYPYADADGQAVLYRERNASRPFLLEVAQDVRGLGVRCYAVPRRYAAAPLAEHLIGYLDGEGRGAAGLEAALDDILSTGGQDILRCAVTAQGRLRRGSEPVLEKASAAARGVRLTLSRSIQRAAEGVAAESMAAGCILILEAGSGKVRACVSRPGFDPAHVGESLTAPDSPLLNRALSAYAVGSVFKPVVAAAALEAGEGDFVRDCPGYDSRNGQVYRCAGSVPHGLVGLGGALEKSCNGYFIELGRRLGPERVRQMAAALGFGKGQDIAAGLRASAGVLHHHDGPAGLVRRVKAREPVIFQLLALPELSGLGRTGLSRGSALRRSRLLARSLRHDARQQALQPLCRLFGKHPPGRTVGQRRKLLAGGLVHDTLHEKGGAVDAARRDGVHHPRRL